MLEEEVKDFLRRHPPFDLLSEEELGLVVQDISIEYYPKGVKILSQGGNPTEYLRIIKKGAVKVYVESHEGEELNIDFRTEGELFGYISMISGDRSRANVVAIEDTLCYLIPKERVLALVETNPALNQYFLKSFFINFIDKTYEETKKRFSIIGEGERLLFTTPIGEIVRRAPVTVSAETRIRDAARIMTKEQISSVIVTDSSGVPTGIVTDRDLRSKVVARGRDIDEPVINIMSSHLVRVDADEYCFEALLKMIHYNIHHIVVIKDGRLAGLVSNHDFMLLQGQSPTTLVKEIERSYDISQLEGIKERLVTVVTNLMKDGARAYNLTGLISEVADKVIIKLIEHIEKQIGPAPINYSLFAYGPLARRELTLKPRIHLGIVHEDTTNLSLVRSTKEYFNEFADLLNRTIGSLLTGNNSSHHNEFLSKEQIRSLSDWVSLWERYASDPFRYRPSMEMLDLRSVHGDDQILKSLQVAIYKIVRDTEDFMDYLATETVENRPPLGFFRKFVVEKSGEHRNELNLFRKGIIPVVSSVRLFSLENEINEQSTLRRLKALSENREFSQGNDLLIAFDYLMMLLMHHQIEQIQLGESPDSFINPEQMSTLEKKTLKETFQLMANIYEFIEKGYKTERTP